MIGNCPSITGNAGERTSLVQLGQQLVAQLFVQMKLAHLVSSAVHQQAQDFAVAHRCRR